MSWPPFSPGTAATRVGAPWPCTDVSRLPATNTTARATAAVTMNDARLRILIPLYSCLGRTKRCPCHAGLRGTGDFSEQGRIRASVIGRQAGRQPLEYR